MAHYYEIVVIFRSEGTEEQVKHVVARAEELLKKEGGTITATESWGRRRLTFPIKKHRDGVYVLFKVTADPEAVDRIKRAYRLEDAMLRIMVVRVASATAATPIPATTVTYGARQEWSG